MCPIEHPAQETAIRVGLSDRASMGACSVFHIDFYWLQPQGKIYTLTVASHVCVPYTYNMLLTIEFPFCQFTSHMELTSPPIVMCLVSSGTSNECNIQVFWCQEAPRGTILGT